MKYLILFLFPVLLLAQNETDKDQILAYLTSDTWNIAYNISPEGERIDEENQEKIRSNWVKFNQDGSYEMPGGVMGKTTGRWTYEAETRTINFTENKTKYKAIIEEISDMNLVLNYVDYGGYKIGLIHYVFIPKPKTEEEIVKIITSGKWNVIVQFFDNIEDKTPVEQIAESWYEFYPDNSYKRSEYLGEEPSVREGNWFVNDKLEVVLDGNEMTTYSVSGDKSTLILTSNADGIRIINCRKAKTK